VTVASLESSSDSILGLLAVRGLVNAKGYLGDGVAIVQSDGGHRGDGAAVRPALNDSLLERDVTLRGGLGSDSGGGHDGWYVLKQKKRCHV
jgi:hypothetical protein